ncbi:HNH endonuclease [Paludibaculum fermentans]|uniref:HNH endonuclease n=1 Tax=Paludibaculum fermentans TaxID=1473598 RepID=UPI003EBF591F
MARSKDELKRIFDRSSGKCHLCHEWLSFEEYGKVKAQGGWEIEHSKPRAKGGTNHINNLYPACVACNRSKGTKQASQVRSSRGKTRSPLNSKQREKAKSDQAAKGLGVGTLAGYLLDPTGGVLTAVGLVLGGLIGRSRDPDK